MKYMRTYVSTYMSTYMSNNMSTYMNTYMSTYWSSTNINILLKIDVDDLLYNRNCHMVYCNYFDRNLNFLWRTTILLRVLLPILLNYTFIKYSLVNNNWPDMYLPSSTSLLLTILVYSSIPLN